ncbi:hypothetical protein ACFXPX_32350, partial [Kitasatospora sp. NPDC059146]
MEPPGLTHHHRSRVRRPHPRRAADLPSCGARDGIPARPDGALYQLSGGLADADAGHPGDTSTLRRVRPGPTP